MMRGRMIAGVGQRLLMIAAGLTVTLLLVEGALRMFPVSAVEIHRRGPARAEGTALFEYDPSLGWRGRPRAHGGFTGWEFTTSVDLNSRGFRDPEIDAAKAPGVVRVVLLGDSITWGHGVEQSERYGDLLAAALRGRGVTAEVVNLAVSGYATDQELLLWEHDGRPYCADVVLLGLYENDVRENALPAQGPYPKPYFRLVGDGRLVLENVPVPRVPAAATPAEGRGRVRSWLQRHLRLWAALAFARETLRGTDPAATAPAEPPPGAVDLTATLIRRLAGRVRDDGGGFGVIVLPDLYYSMSMTKAASRSGVAAILDLAPAFRRAADGRGPLFHRLDGAHWTPRSHAIAAEAIADWLIAVGLLARSARTCETPA